MKDYKQMTEEILAARDKHVKNRSRRIRIIGSVTAAVLVFAAVVFVVITSNEDKGEKKNETPSEVTSEACFMALEDVLGNCDFIVKAEYEGTIDHGEYVENKFIVKNVICGQCEEKTLLLYANKSWLNDYGKKNESQVSNPEVTESTPEQSTNNKDVVSSSTASYSTKYETGMEYYLPINIYYDEKGDIISVQTVIVLEICPEKSVYRYVNDSIREGGKIISSEEEIVEYLKKYCIYS